MIFRIYLQVQDSNRGLCMEFRIKSTDMMCASLIMYDFSHTPCCLLLIYEVIIGRATANGCSIVGLNVVRFDAQPAAKVTDGICNGKHLLYNEHHT